MSSKNTEYGQIDSTFLMQPLSYLCVDKGGVQTGPFGSQLHQKDYVEYGTPIITVEHLGENRVVHSNLPRVTDQDRKRLSKYWIHEGDIVFSRVGSVDRRALVSSKEDGWLFSGRCLRVRPKQELLDSTYLSYFFGSEGFKKYIRSIAVGATMPSINTKILSEIPIYYPEVCKQKKMGTILKSLDDKTDLNQRINKTLEEMAQALFKCWFVDFEPTRAKMAGESPDSICQRLNLTPAILALFPDRLKDDELPLGWRVMKLNQIADINPRETLSKGAKAPYLKMAALPTVGCWPRPPVLRSFKSGTKFKNGDTLLARITPCLENGKTAFINCLAADEVAWGSTEYYVIRTKSGIPNELGYILARNPKFRRHAIQSMTGTSGRQRAQKDVVEAFELILPPADNRLLQIYGEMIQSWFLLIKNNSEEMESLSQIRDTLLPKLLSGQLSVTEKEIQ